MNYKDWLDKWLNCYVKPNVKEQTFDRYESIINRHISTGLGEYGIEDLTAIVLQEFVSSLVKALATSTVNAIITVIKKSLKVAQNIGLIKDNPADKIQRPKLVEKKVECFTLNEQKRLEKYVLHKAKKQKMFGIVLCLYTGIRIGELLALKWNDVDMAKGLIFVTQTCRDTYKSGGYIKRLDTVKTENSNRVIPIPKQILPYLKSMKKSSAGEFVITDKNKTVSVRSYQKTFAGVLNKLKIPHRGFHSLRHTFATRALECGMDVRTLSEILGHKNPTITLKRYAHSMLEHKTEMMNKLGKYLQE